MPRYSARRIAALFVVMLAAATLFAGPAAAATALDKLDRGPKVGASIPHPLTANDHNGKAQEFSSLTGTRGLILLFTRSLDW